MKKNFNMLREKEVMLSILKNKSGIYSINKRYVGSSKDLRSRLYIYYNIKRLMSSNMIIYKALLKYGFENFNFQIIEYCSIENLKIKEQYYINKLRPEYNMLNIAGSSLGYKHTEITLLKYKNRKISASTRINLSIAATNRKLDAITKLKISNSHKGKILSNLTKEKLSLAAKKVKVQVFNILRNKTTDFDSITEAANMIGVSRTAIYKAIKNKRKCKNIYLIKYI